MRRRFTWLAGIAGIAALLRRHSRTRVAIGASLSAAPATDVTDPAIELRQKLEETRMKDPEPSAETDAAVSLAERRARIHERAQDAINLMHGSDDPTTDEGSTS